MKIGDAASGLFADVLGAAVVFEARTFPPMPGQPGRPLEGNVDRRSLAGERAGPRRWIPVAWHVEPLLSRARSGPSAVSAVTGVESRTTSRPLRLPASTLPRPFHVPPLPADVSPQAAAAEMAASMLWVWLNPSEEV